MTFSERQLEEQLIKTLRGLKYEYRSDIRDRAALERNFREKFESLNRVTLTDGEFERLLDEIVTPDVFTASRTLREINSFTRDDGTPLNYTLVNIKDWCKNTFEVVNQLRINTDNSHHRYDVMLLINGVPAVQIELKTLGISPRRAMQQIVDYKNDPGNGYNRTLLCFVQLFIVSNRADTWYFTNNNTRHFAFNAEERFLPIYQFAAEDNSKITHLDDFAEQFLAKCTLGNMISRYTVLVASEQKLLMMRPYQIYAVQRIVDCIEQNSGNTEFEIYHGDTLKNEWDWLRETNPAKKPKFDAVVANPPFSYRWKPRDEASEDMRFKNHGVAPKSAADFAFLLHGFHYLKDDGVMAIILPHGVLFRGGAEARIRRKLLEDGHIDTVIGLPANLFYSTGIPVCILVLKKCKKPEDVLIINAEKHFEKGKRQNYLTDKHIAKIINTYRERPEKPVERYARRVEMDEIERNDFNLNISRYVSTAEPEKEIDLAETHKKLDDIEKEIGEAKDRHNGFLKQLGLPPLP